MKPPRLALLVVSLLANAALGAWWLSIQPSTASPPPQSAGITPVTTRASPAPAVPPSETWQKISAGTDTDFVAYLRQQNFPPWAITSLVAARVRSSFAPQLAALEKSQSIPWWQRPRENWSLYQNLSPEARIARRELNREIAEQIKHLAGAPPPDAYDALYRERRYGALDPALASSLEAVERDYDEVQQQLRDQTGSYQFPSDKEKLGLLEQEKRRDLAELLTPEQLREYDLRNSPASMNVRRSMTWFEGTEEEYRALTAQRLDFEATLGGSWPDDRDARRAAEKQLLESARSVLTPERFAYYEITNDPNFDQTAYHLRNFNYDSSKAVAAVKIQRAISARRDAIQKNPAFDAAQKSAALGELYRDARNQLSAHLNPASIDAMEADLSWLKSLKAATQPKTGGGKK